MSAGFQKYVEGMNRQPLDKKPEDQGAGKLLPHQRRGVSNRPVTADESKTQAITKSCDTENLHDTLQQGVSAAAPSALMKSGVVPGEHSSPEYKKRVYTHQNEALSLDYRPKLPEPQPANPDSHQQQSRLPTQEIQQYELSQSVHTASAPGGIRNGLAKSRWASPSYNVEPVGEVRRSPPIPSNNVKNEQRDTIGKKATTSFNLTTGVITNWSPIEKSTSPTRSVVSTPIFESNPLIKEYNDDTTQNWNQPSYTHENTLGALGDTENKTYTSGFQSLVTVGSIASTGDNPETTAKHAESIPQAEEVRICEQNFNGTLHDPRGNWPTGSDSREEPSLSVANNDQDWPRRHDTKSSNTSSSPGDEVAPRHMSEFIKAWIQSAHVVNTTFLSQKIAENKRRDCHEDCDIDTYEGKLLAPIDHPMTKKGGFEGF